MRMHRKIWEWCFIAQALYEREMLKPGRRGLGFGVGQEPLVALFASCGSDILATDMREEEALKSGSDWVGTSQHARGIEDMNKRGICDPQEFRKHVSFRVVDMNHIPDDLRDFDFCWSSCAFDHLGTLEKGEEFIHNMMNCLRPGGVAVHTTEYNLSSNTTTVEHGDVVFFRKCDFEEIAARLRKNGHRIDLDFTLGNGEADRFVDKAPYRHNPHLRFQYGEYVSTSFALLIEKSS